MPCPHRLMIWMSWGLFVNDLTACGRSVCLGVLTRPQVTSKTRSCPNQLTRRCTLSEQSLGGSMFPVSNVQRNVLILSGISIASSVRSAGFGGHEYGIGGWKNGLWVIGQLGQWFPLLRGHSLSFGVLTVAGATPLASWIRDKFSGKTNKQTVVIKKSFKLQKWLKFCLELSAEVSFGRFSDWSRLRLTLP